MSMCNCNCRCACVLAAVIASVVVGVVSAFLQIAGVITVGIPFLWVALGIAVVYLGVLTVAAALTGCRCQAECACAALGAVLTGILGTALFSLVLLAVGIVATSVVSAILVGLLLLSLALTLTGTACYVRALTNCDE